MAYGIPYPGIFVVDEKGIVTARYFEDDYRQRFTIAGILRAHFGEAIGVTLAAIETDHLRIVPSMSAPSAATGQRVVIDLEIDMKPGMHVYAPGVQQDYIPIRWDMTDSPDWKAHAPVFPPARRMRLAGDDVPVYEKKFRIRRDVTITPKPGSLGTLVIKGSVRYQACDETKCFPPQTVPVELSLRLEPPDRERAPMELRRPAAK